MDCGLNTIKADGLFAKGPDAARDGQPGWPRVGLGVARSTVGCGAREGRWSTGPWWTGGARVWRGPGPWWTGRVGALDCGPRWTAAGTGRVRAAAGLAAAAPWPASRRACSAALWSTGNNGEGTGVLRGLRRARCARWLRGSRAGEDGLCGGAARRRWRNCGEIIRVKGRERYGGKGTVGIPTSLQCSGTGFSSVRRVGARDRRRWLELLGAAMAVHC